MATLQNNCVHCNCVSSTASLVRFTAPIMTHIAPCCNILIQSYKVYYECCVCGGVRPDLKLVTRLRRLQRGCHVPMQ